MTSRRAGVVADDEELEPLYNTANENNEPETKPWDIFRDPPRKAESGSTEQYKVLDASVKILKILTIFFVFSMVLMGAVISKATLLFMTSQIKPGITRPYCRQHHEYQQFLVTIPTTERVGWMWMLIFAYIVPELGTFIRSVRLCFFKTWKTPVFTEWMSLFFTESLPAVGSAIFVFVVLPELDVVKGAMLTNAICFVPSVVALISRNPDRKNTLNMFLDFLCVMGQASCFVVWPLVEQRPVLYMIPVSVILISCGWWENYVSDKSKFEFIRHLGAAKRDFKTGTYFMYCFISLWKCVLFFISVLVIVAIQEGESTFMFSKFADALSEHTLYAAEVEPIIPGANISDAIQKGTNTGITVDGLTPIWVFLINITATYLCYIFSKFACKVMFQQLGMAFPINLVVPVLVSILIGVSGVYNNDFCTYMDVVPSYLFFNTPPLYLLSDFLSQQHCWIWLIWLLSQAWITVHTWTPHVKKLVSTEMLFLKPMYDAFFIDQSIAMNRRRQRSLLNGEDEADNAVDKTSTTRIYACGTMWHETKEEMMEFLKSIFRLDEDQHVYQLVKKFANNEKNMANYYELETHVFFDDAFIRKHKDDQDPGLNEYVHYLIEAMDDAASEVHNVRMKVKPPKVYVTPYGGRIVWTLPGKSKMIAHLKDAAKIRKKKRWSQVMYMYYLLGHKIMEQEDLTPGEKAQQAVNTYLLALDGDIDFQPEAVHLLVDYMKKNKNLGAACGRIHPIGSGAMVWYQMFEYAIGHWLQKATEHVIGCVLCSPGCFSLFRGKALMEDSVMRKYTTTSSEARHYVQYDQGEDRWLCTLLLQQGFRVEYSAASDAYTHCPEGFNEFYNQRRRWMPSTMANILDLLGDYKHTVRMNDNISLLYIYYQVIMMIGTVIGPGTIFLMLVGAFVAAFKIDQWTSFMLNLVPILIFIVICATCKSDVQLFFAGLISAVYGLVMMAVLLGMMLQIHDDGPFAPSSIFIFCLAGEFIITALLHPKEFHCLKYGIIYYVTVPSMYMLLVIYSIFNMNNVSWGTREVSVLPADNPQNAAPQNVPPTYPVEIKGKKVKNETGSIVFSCAGLFKCLLCTHKEKNESEEILIQIQKSLKDLQRKMDNIEGDDMSELSSSEMRSSSARPSMSPRKTVLRRQTSHRISTVTEISETESLTEDTESINVPENSWLYEGDLNKGEVCQLEKKENLFWCDLLDKYLSPIDDADKKEKIEKDLRDLRDKMVFSFFMLNSLFVLVVFLLTLEKETLHIDWPVDPKVNFTYFEDSNEIRLYKSYLSLEPIGMVFLIFFAILIVVQFFAMLIHRFGTFSQIISNTEIQFGTKDLSNVSEEVLEQENIIANIRKLQKIKNLYEDENPDPDSRKRRETVHHLAMKVKQKHQTEAKFLTLEEAFMQTLKAKNNSGGALENARRQTQAYLRRRTTLGNPPPISGLNAEHVYAESST